MAMGDEGRARALRFYEIQSWLLGILGAALLVCGISAVATYDPDSFGMPYFLGGFIVGIMTLISSAVCRFILQKAPDSADNDVKKKELACAIKGQYILSMVMIMGCILGCVSAGVGGLRPSGFYDKGDDSTKKALAVVILLGCIGAIFLTVFSMCITCTYSSYFGVELERRGYRRELVYIDIGGNTTMPATPNTTTFQSGGNTTTPVTIHATTFHPNIPQTQGDQISRLETQNRLLQQQLELQRQLFQQQQQQTQYSGGFYPPPPPPSYGFSDPGPSSPPPSYNEVK